MNKVGTQVQNIRLSLELTQEELVARCNLLEWNISRSTLAKIESKVRRVTDIEVELLAAALQVDIERLFSAD